MANREKGEVALKALGKTWTLRYSTNALCELEDAVGVGAVSYVQEMAEWEAEPEKMEIRKVRLLVWCGLTDNHPDVSLKVAGEIISDIGLSDILPQFMEAFQLSFPDSEEEGNANPPNAAAK